MPTSALLPMGGAVSGVAGVNWALIGDAAACVNPLNGEGIDYGLETGRLVVETMADHADLSGVWPALLRDHFGRLLAFVFRRDDDLLVNRELLAEGLAEPLSIPPNRARRAELAAIAAEARRQARPNVVHQAILSPRSHWAKHAGLALPRFEIPPAVWKIYPDLSHAHDWEEAIAVTSFVPDEVIAQLCDAMGLVGTPEDCARRIVEMTSAGVTNLYIMALETFVGPERELRAFRDEIFPRLRAAGYR